MDYHFDTPVADEVEIPRHGGDFAPNLGNSSPNADDTADLKAKLRRSKLFGASYRSVVAFVDGQWQKGKRPKMLRELRNPLSRIGSLKMEVLEFYIFRIFLKGKVLLRGRDP